MITNYPFNYRHLGLIALAALMAATRFHHFASTLALPDASLAVFFLAGLWFAGRYLFIFLLLEAGLIDYLAITQFGVSDFCISSAYFFLIPTYFVMWSAGKFCQPDKALLKDYTVLKQITLLSLATASAFLISNGSFYLFSGRFTELTWPVYSAQFGNYFPPYLLAALAYVGVIYALVMLFQRYFTSTTALQHS